MENLKEDRRVRRTQRLLKESLTDLMTRKAFKNITIKDITDRADLNRGTFYLHYTDTYELLAAVENDVLDDFQSIISVYLKEGTGNDLLPILIPVIHYLVEHAEICMNLFENDASCNFNNKFKALIQKNSAAIVERLLPAQSVGEYAYFLEFVIYGLIGIIRKWMTDGMVQPEEEIAQTANHAILSVIKSLPIP